MNEAGQDSPRTDLGGKDKPVPGVTPERWQKIKELFIAASERNPNDRAEFLNQSCGSDESLRSEVESMLTAERHAAGSTFLDIALTPDRMVGRRVGAYRIVERIASGGMAAVYLAVRADDQYQKQVAVKVVHPQSASEELLNRFRTERQTLAGLDHPNIVKLLDGGSTDEGLPYLVMDYVEGTPIDEYCDAGRLSIEGRLRLFCQVCAAVHYAHQHLVVHRDLKPSNILVTPGGAPKLLDFGIAKVFDPHIPAQTLVVTQTATRRMTPAYASPEQVRGQAVTAGSDVYSLGVILYELLTGHRPYKLTQPTPADIEHAICEVEPEKLSTAIDRVETVTGTDGATSATLTPELVSQTREGEPEKLRRRLRGDLDNIVLKALQKAPKRRYASVKELADDLQRHLDHLHVQARPSTLTYRASKFVSRRKTEVVAATLLLFMLAGGISFTFWETRRARETAEASIENQHSKGRPSVAVLGFKNLSGKSETAWLSTALSEMLTTELAAGGQLRTAPGENVAQMKINLALPEADALSRETLRRVRKNLNSDFLVLGSYLDQGENNSRQVRLDVRLQDAVTGETLTALSETGTETNLSELVTRAGAALRGKLGAGRIPPDESTGIKASLPSNTDAVRWYAEGLAKLRVFDALEARGLLEKAVAAEPGFALAHSALAEAWTTLGYEAKAREESKKALDLAAGLPRDQSLLIEGRFYETANEWDKAIESYRTLFNFFPDNIDFGLRLAGAQALASRGRDLLATVNALRKIPPPAGDDPRIDLMETNAANYLSDYKRQAAVAQDAVRKANSLGARLVEARAKLAESAANRALGNLQGAKSAAEEARRIFATAGDRSGEARALRDTGRILVNLGDFENGKKALQESIKIQDEIGNRTAEMTSLINIGTLLYRQGDIAGAKEASEQSLAIARELGDPVHEVDALQQIAEAETSLENLAEAKKHFGEALALSRNIGNLAQTAGIQGDLGVLLMQQGDFTGAKEAMEESLKINRHIGSKDEVARALVNLGGLRANFGAPGPAQKFYAEALQLFRQTGNQPAVCHTLYVMGEALHDSGDKVGARGRLEEALSIQEKIGAKGDAAHTRMSLANLAMDDRRFSDAEGLARQAVEELKGSKDSASEAEAQCKLAQTLHMQGKLQEAQSAIENAAKLEGNSGDVGTRLPIAIEAARIQAAMGRTTEAQKMFEDAIEESRKVGALPFEFEARLAQAQAKIKAGDSVGGRAELKAIEKEAKTKGFVQVADEAAQSAKQR